MATTNQKGYALIQLVTWNEDGLHFTTSCPFWAELEKEGLIEVFRPVDHRTGQWLPENTWQVYLTDDGQAWVEDWSWSMAYKAFSHEQENLRRYGE